MIGIINSGLYFEFQNEGDLAKALGYYGQQHNNCITLFIIDKNCRLKGLLNNAVFTFPPDLISDYTYFILGSSSAKGANSKKDFVIVPNEYDELPKTRFIFVSQKIPKPLNY